MGKRVKGKELLGAGCCHSKPAKNIAAAGDPMESSRIDVVFRLWQCDKKNHGWREGRR
jgi:hypothetical protein